MYILFGYRITDGPMGHPMQSHNKVRDVNIGRDKSSLVSGTTIVALEVYPRAVRS